MFNSIHVYGVFSWMDEKGEINKGLKKNKVEKDDGEDRRRNFTEI
jgi:hypothetical protein